MHLQETAKNVKKVAFDPASYLYWMISTWAICEFLATWFYKQ